MKIFIGSSSESIDLLDEICVWIENNGYEPIPWTKPGLFVPGANTMETLIEISENVDGAIFIFSEDDKVWYRKDTLLQPRDNVLLEYGLFVGKLGQTKSIIVKNRRPKEASDIKGINYIDASEKRRARAKVETNLWCQKLKQSNANPALLQIEAKLYTLKLRNNEILNELEFEKEKSKEYEGYLTKNGIKDFKNFDINTDGQLKLLYRIEYVKPLSELLQNYFENPAKLSDFLTENDFERISGIINWTHISEETRTSLFLRKILRVFRLQNDYSEFNRFTKCFEDKISNQINNIAEAAIIKDKF